MAFTDKHGITALPTVSGYERLSISYDNEDGTSVPNSPGTRAVLLFVPDINDPGHEHIELSDETAKTLRDWLTEYLNSKARA